MKTRTVKLGGRDWEFEANNNGWIVSGPKEAEDLVLQTKIVGNGSKGNPVFEDEAGVRHTIGVTRLMSGHKTAGTSGTSRTSQPRLSEKAVDEILALKGLSAETRAEFQSIKDEWVKVREAELKNKVLEAQAKLSLEDMAKLLGLVK